MKTIQQLLDMNGNELKKIAVYKSSRNGFEDVVVLGFEVPENSKRPFEISINKNGSIFSYGFNYTRSI